MKKIHKIFAYLLIFILLLNILLFNPINVYAEKTINYYNTTEWLNIDHNFLDFTITFEHTSDYDDPTHLSIFIKNQLITKTPADKMANNYVGSSHSIDCKTLPAATYISHPGGNSVGFKAEDIKIRAHFSDGSTVIGQATTNLRTNITNLVTWNSRCSNTNNNEEISPEPTPTPTPTPDPAPVVTEPKKAPVASSTLPKTFTKDGSKTTDLSKLNEDTARKVKNFTLDNKGVGNIKFNEALNLSGDLKKKFNNLDKYVSIQYGYVKVDSKNLKVLNKKATISLKMNLNLAEGKVPVILKDGRDAGKAISKVKYEKGILSFKVNGFSEYSVKPTLKLEEVEEEVNDDKVTIKGSVDDLKSNVMIFVNDSEEGVEVEITEEGTFEKEVELAEGENTIKVQAKSENGETSEQELSVKYVLGNENTEEKESNTSLYVAIGLIGFSILGLTAIGGVIVFKLIKKRKKKKE